MFDRVFLSEKYKATYSIGSKTNVSKSKRKKEDKRKARKRSSLAVENRKSRASVIFLSLPQGERGGGGGGAPVDREYVPEKYGVPSIDVDLDGLGLFMSLTDIACLGDLLNAYCFIGEAEGLVKEFLSSTS